MTIEAALERIAVALETLVSDKQKEPAPKESAPAATPTEAPARRRRSTTPPVESAATSSSTVKTDPEPTGGEWDDEAPAPKEPPPKKLTTEDVRAALVELQTAMGSPSYSKEILKAVTGGEVMSGVKESHFGIIIEKCKARMLAGK